MKSKSEAKHKAINMEMQAPLRESEVQNWNLFESLPAVDRSRLAHTQVKDIQLLDPLFDFLARAPVAERRRISNC